MSLWEGATDMEVHGNLIYNCGWDGATDRGHGHGILRTNRTGTKRIPDNIIFNQYGEGNQHLRIGLATSTTST